MEREDHIIDIPLGSTSSDNESKNELIDNQFDLNQLIYKNRWAIGFLLLGIFLLGVGILSARSLNLFKDDTRIEVLGEFETGKGNLETKSMAGGEIMVEVVGEVENPAVYQLNEGDRIGDLVSKAGGLSANADRDYVSKNINMAQKLSDGVKIYIPKVGEMESGEGGGGKENNNGTAGVADKININTASVSQLDTLWGVGEATAKKIIDNRPYQKPEELLQKKIVKSNVWEAIKDQVTAW